MRGARSIAPPSIVRLHVDLIAANLDLPVYDPAQADDLLEKYLPTLEAVPPDALEHPRVDIVAVGLGLLKVVALTQVPAFREELEVLSGAERFEIANLTWLRDLTILTMHTSRKADIAGTTKATTRIPPELDAASKELEKRMQKVCEDFFGDDERILALRAGTGYIDRAYDLLGYAEYYATRAAIVAGHPLYRAGDLEEANKLGGKILAIYDTDQNPEQKLAFDQLRRAWTLLEAVYFEVRSVALGILRYVPEREELFPTVYVLGRKGQGRKKSGAAAPSED
ncbi:MAG: hypothetical protein U0441_03755 [Polyangiaceae bacterium]